MFISYLCTFLPTTTNGLKPNSSLFFWHYHPLWVCILQPSSGARVSSLTRFHDHTQRRATVGRIPLDEWSVRRRDRYLTTHNTHNRQTSMPAVGTKLQLINIYIISERFWKFPLLLPANSVVVSYVNCENVVLLQSCCPK